MRQRHGSCSPPAESGRIAFIIVTVVPKVTKVIVSWHHPRYLLPAGARQVGTLSTRTGAWLEPIKRRPVYAALKTEEFLPFV